MRAAASVGRGGSSGSGCRRVAHATQQLLDSLVTTAPPKDRELEKQKAIARSEKRFPKAG